MSKKTLDEAFELLPDGVHIGMHFDFISKEWYIEFNQEPFGKLVHYDETGMKTLPEIIEDACRKWEGN